MLSRWLTRAGQIRHAQGVRGISRSRAPLIGNEVGNESGSVLADIEANKVLLNSYNPWSEFFNLFTGKGFEQLVGLQERDKIINLTKDPFGAAAVFVDLRNPLLKKYRFEPPDFLKGSKEAFLQINRIIGGNDLFNFANGFVKTSDKANLLQASVCPQIYEACLLAARAAGSGLTKTTLTGLEVLDCAIKRVSVKLMEEGDIDGEGVSVTAAAAAAAVDDLPLSPPASTASKSSAPRSMRKPTEKVLASYPLGSVGIVVDVGFTARESYTTTMPTGDDVAHERMTVQRWTFVGELSGKQELDYIVTSFQLSSDDV